MAEESIEPVKIEPDTLAVSIGSFTRQTWKLIWEKNHLVYAVYGEDYEPKIEEKVTPEPEAWLRFWSVLDGTEAWDWDPYYHATAEEGEGTIWQIEILLKDGRHLDTGGSNSFPGLAEMLAHTAAKSRGAWTHARAHGRTRRRRRGKPSGYRDPGSGRRGEGCQR